MNRRRFIFWLSFGIFSLSEKLHSNGLDKLAAAMMRFGGPNPDDATDSSPEHWTSTDNNTWRWFERENYIAGKWKLTGVTTPINKQTGEPYTGRTGYLDESLVPSELRSSEQPTIPAEYAREPIDPPPHVADEKRRARHGRPPSAWLRSLNADEIRIWLKTIEVPEAGVSGMTFWTHLTRDHFFSPTKITGLTIDEQAKLHAAAHYGY